MRSQSSALVSQAVILVGGKGTRLGDATKAIPKPLVSIDGDRRFLDYLLEEVARQGFDDIVLVAGHLGEQVRERYDGRSIGSASTVRVVVEEQPAGTGGALLVAREWLEPVFLLLNGDAFLDFNIRAFERGAAALPQRQVIGVLEVEDARRYGTVRRDGSRVTAFLEKDPASIGPGVVNAGLYRLHRDILDDIVETPCSIESTIFPKLAAEGRLGAIGVEGWFLDIGLPDTLAQARRELPARTARPCAFLDRDGTLNVDEGYTHRIEDLVWIDGARTAIRRLNDRGYRVIVCTNQAGIARGLFSEDDMHRFHRAMQHELAGDGAFIDAFYHCPFHVDAVLDAYRADHPDRKPKPGLLLRAQQDWAIDRARSFMVGDHQRDVEAGQAAGVRSYLYRGGSLDDLVREALADTAAAKTAA